MMLKSWNSIEEVPYYFSRSSVKFQGHKGQISLILSIIERFRLSLQFEFTDGFEIISKAWSNIEEVPYCLSRSSIKFQGHTGQKCDRQFRPKLSVSGLQLQFEFTNGFEMMHKAWCSTEEVPYCFSRSSIKFEALMDRKIDDLNPILSKITRLVAAIKSLRFALFYTHSYNTADGDYPATQRTRSSAIVLSHLTRNILISHTKHLFSEKMVCLTDQFIIY